MPELVALSDKEYKSFLKFAMGWLLLGLLGTLLFVITMLFVYFELGNHILLKVLGILQFSLIPVAVLYYLKNKKLIKRFLSNARNT